METTRSSFPELTFLGLYHHVSVTFNHVSVTFMLPRHKRNSGSSIVVNRQFTLLEVSSIVVRGDTEILYGSSFVRGPV